jgi:pimeloyl-ACP methyl ester carboxylesterase
MPTYHGADGAPLHYDVLGADSGSPLIVLAGGAGRHPAYLGDLAGLSEHHQLVVPHLRGVGRSSAADIARMGSRWRQADDMDRLRRSLNLDRCTLVAHSAGTRLAIAYAARFPDRLAGLVLMNPPASYLVDVPSDSSTVIAARIVEPAFARAVSAFTAGPDPGGDDTFNDWQQAIAPMCYARWDDAEQAHARCGRYSLAANRAFLAGAEPADLLDRLHAVLAPTLVVAGAQDAIAGVEPAVAVADLFVAGRAVVIEGCAHTPWVDQAALFRAAVIPFLAQLEPHLR